jgi:single-strand DNA-binding protein
VILVGRLVADPELSYTPSGKAVTKMRLATNTGAAAEFHAVELWERTAEVAAEYLTKGRLVYIDGSLRANSWSAEDGSKRSRTVVVASTMKMLSGTPAAAQ